MKKINVLLLMAIMACISVAPAYAFDWGSLLGGLSNAASNASSSSSDTTSTSSSTSAASLLGSILGGVLQNNDLEVKDIAGTWNANGPSVQFKSDNLLEQAGGAAAASAIEEKIMPYYKKLGLEGMSMTITTDGSVTIKLKNGKTFKGTVTKGEEKGKMVFSFSSYIKKGVTVEVSKTGNNLSMLADVSKLQELLALASDKLNSQQLSTITNLLNNYDGVYVGIKLTK